MLESTKRVLDVGQCDPDHAAIRQMLERHFSVRVDRAHGLDDAIQAVRTHDYDLVLVNRIFDRDGMHGLELIRRIREDDVLRHLPVMLVSNYDDAQSAAVEVGALQGFGKAELEEDETLRLLRPILGEPAYRRRAAVP